MDPTTEQNLLFGLLALQNGLVQQADLVACFQAWTQDKSRPLADRLVEASGLAPRERKAIEAVVAVHLKKHAGSVGESLAGLPAPTIIIDVIGKLDSPELSALLTRTMTAWSEAQTDPTTPYEPAFQQFLGSLKE